MAPISQAVRASRSISHMAAAAVTPALTSTPTVASSAAGFSPVRKVATAVRRPPSSRITASATLPTQKLSTTSSKRQPMIPSSPARMPASRNTSRKEKPTRVENRPAITLRKTSEAAANRGRLTASTP